MKKIIISLLILFVSASAFAQTPDELFSQYKGKKNAEYVHLGRVLFKMLKPIVNHHADDPTAKAVMRGIKSLRVLDLEECSQKVKQQFAQSAKGLTTKGYEPIVSSNTDGDRTLILVRQKKSSIRELLILNTGDDDCTLVQLKGKIKPENVSNIIKKIK
ncbi:MAG: DUF4252 domain-containing protein [Prevotella sp.]|nr:DUF4252 domain-containing protein [Prevotella sp.]